jgi:L-ascorbate metabolism protein UlaG (beta-lactamase superfamily)
MRITHHGHACLLVETTDARILIDPGNFSRGLDHVGDLDLVVMTHQHADHADPDQLRTVLTNSPQTRVVAEAQTAAAVTEATAGEITPEPLTSGQSLTAGSGTTLDLVGELHAFNHDQVPQVGNLGVVVTAPEGGRLFHPGDAYDAEPGPVDVLALPLSAPWCAIRDTLEFVRRLSPRVAVPIHDALLSDGGRAMYLMHTGRFGGDDLEVRDLSDGTPADF